MASKCVVDLNATRCTAVHKNFQHVLALRLISIFTIDPDILLVCPVIEEISHGDHSVAVPPINVKRPAGHLGKRESERESEREIKERWWQNK